MSSVQLSCQQCQSRKRRCDKCSPCSSCELAGLQCTPILRKRLPRGRSGQSERRFAALTGHVERLQDIIDNARKGDTRSSDLGQTDRQNVLEPPGGVAQEFWAELVETVDGLQGIIDAPDDEATKENPLYQQSNAVSQLPNLPTSVFASCATPIPIVGGTFLTEKQENLFVQFYRDRVDCVLKTLHWPTAAKMIAGASTRDGAHGSAQALKAAVLFMGLCSLEEDECEREFQCRKQALLPAMQTRAEYGLTQAHVLQTPDLVSLQAFVTYLQAIRTCGAFASSWTLLAIAIRLSGVLGLGSNSPPTKSPFEIDLERRLWYSICLMDTQAALDRGSTPMVSLQGLGSPPLNTCDYALSPEMVREHSSNGVADMSFAFLSYEAMLCDKKINEDPSSPSESADLAWNRKLSILASFENECHARYLDIDRVHPMIPYDLVSSAAYSMIFTMRLNLRRPPYPRAGAGPPHWDDYDVLQAGIDILEGFLSRYKTGLSKFRWKRWIPWYALAVVLAELIRRPHTLQWDRGFACALRIFQEQAAPPTDHESGPLWRPIAKLLRHVIVLREKRIIVCTTDVRSLSSKSWPVDTAHAADTPNDHALDRARSTIKAGYEATASGTAQYETATSHGALRQSIPDFHAIDHRLGFDQSILNAPDPIFPITNAPQELDFGSSWVEWNRAISDTWDESISLYWAEMG